MIKNSNAVIRNAQKSKRYAMMGSIDSVSLEKTQKNDSGYLSPIS
jgi:hypothetical protein